MDIDLALLADAATIDGSGKLNILGVFDRISASAFPAQHGRMAMVLRFAAGLAIPEIAAVVGKREAAVRKQITRTLHTLKELSEKESTDARR